MIFNFFSRRKNVKIAGKKEWCFNDVRDDEKASVLLA